MIVYVRILYLLISKGVIMKKNLITIIGLLAAAVGLNAADGTVSLSTGYPGGNLQIIKQDPGQVEINADLRDSAEWFYWNFDAEATQAGTVRFVFPEKKWRISAQGPAYSTDGGETWQWLGREKVKYINKENTRDSFEWTFKTVGEKVRFAQGIPYQKKNFDDFIAKHQSSPYLKQQILTKTRKGVDTPLLVIGSGEKNILITARHHSCEAMASYAFEGFLSEALSDSPAGKEFRDKYTLYAVPFMDLDGVEAGDQGKGRKPHDHNRDYALGDAAIYPEVKAVINLDKEKKFFVTLDFHAPALRNDIHEVIYFAGYVTPSNKVNTLEFKSWLDDERPANTGMIPVLGSKSVPTPNGKDGVANALYFAVNPTTVYGTTIEFAYAASGNIHYDHTVVREYGISILKALLKTDFSKDLTPRTAYKKYAEFKKSINIGRPDHAVEKCTEVLLQSDLPVHYHTAALVQRAFSYARMRNYKNALADNEAVIASPNAIRQQKYSAIVQKSQVLCTDPAVLYADAEAWLKKVLDEQLVADSYLYNVCDTYYDYLKKNGKNEMAHEIAKI